MAKKIYGFDALTGGAQGALDEIATTNLDDGSLAFGCVSGVFCAYHFDANSDQAESSPDVIAPNTGSGRWIKNQAGGGGGAGDFLVTQVFS
jgi:hypothetical protein